MNKFPKWKEARDEKTGMDRLKAGCVDRGVWDEQWERHSRVQVVLGDLATDKWSLRNDIWLRLANDVDAIVHNGALVRSPPPARILH